jgi:GAF domain-containing protein
MADGPAQLHVVEIAALLRELTALVITTDDLDHALDAVATTSARVAAGPASCAITLIQAGAATTAATSGDLSAEVAEIQYRLGEGPCLSAIQSQEMVVSDDLAADERWPAWRAAVAAHRIAGVLSVPLDIDDQVIGALSLYTAEAGALAPDVQLGALLVAEHAGLLLRAVLDRGRLTDRAADLSDALASGASVNRAIGIVMAQRSCPAEEALEVLHQASTTLRAPLGEVADRLVRTIAGRVEASM